MHSAKFFQVDCLQLASRLLGCVLVRTTPEGNTSGIIVETEAYRQDDAASHSFNGKTARNTMMFGEPGHAYVYFTYGMHYCFNVVGSAGPMAEAVLIRAIQPMDGLEIMKRRRQTADILNLCSGPAKLAQSFGFTTADNGASLQTSELHILPRHSQPHILSSPRVGITKAADKPWRFYIADNDFVSKSKFNHKREAGGPSQQ